MRKLLIITFFCLFATVAYTQEAPKRVVLTPAQVRYYEQISEQANAEIEALPEVKAKRATQQAAQRAFLDGLASANGLTGYKVTPDGKGGASLEQVADKK